MEENVFLDEAELKRLMVQGRLLSEYEQPIYQKVIDERDGLTLLDVGCNNGWKTKERFSDKNFKKIIGIDCLDALVEQAREKLGNEVFSFYACDVASEAFVKKLRKIMKKENIRAFDIIHCSFMLMHTKTPGDILKRLKGFLAPGGKLIVIEPDDSESVMTPDSDGVFNAFLEVLSTDPYAGKRTMGGELTQLFTEGGYGDITLECAEIGASGKEIEKKESIFDTFCSYLPEDLVLLRKQDEENEAYRNGWEWVQNNFDRLRQQMTDEETTISMGVKIYTCGGGGKNED